jgi:hypothetical protein
LIPALDAARKSYGAFSKLRSSSGVLMLLNAAV